MGEPRLSNIIIGVILIGVLSTGFMLFMGAGADKYNTPDYNEQTFSAYSSVAEQSRLSAQEVKNETDTLGASPGDNDFDIFGSLFSSSWTAIKSTDDTMTQLASITTTAANSTSDLMDASFTQVLIGSVGAIISIIIVISIFLHFISKSSRL